MIALQILVGFLALVFVLILVAGLVFAVHKETGEKVGRVIKAILIAVFLVMLLGSISALLVCAFNFAFTGNWGAPS